MSFVDKQDVLKYASDDKEKIVLAHAYDKMVFTDKTGCVGYIGFESPVMCEKLMRAFFRQDEPFPFCFGGYPEAERKVFGFSKDGEKEVPLKVLRIDGNLNGLTHRDFLGSILGLGITRENVGDICVGDSCFVFALPKMAEYIKENLVSVGRIPVKCSLCDIDECHIEPQFENISKSIASERADAVIAAAFNLSRGESCELIKKKLVFVNYGELSSPDKKIGEGDIISVRGKGKARIDSYGGQTKKGRIFINIRKYK